MAVDEEKQEGQIDSFIREDESIGYLQGSPDLVGNIHEQTGFSPCKLSTHCHQSAIRSKYHSRRFDVF